MWTTLRFAWRNLGRSRRRTALTMGTIIVAQLAVLMMSGIMNAYTVNVQGALTGPMLGHVQVHDPQWRDERATDLSISQLGERMAVLDAHPDVQQVFPRVFAPALAALGEEGHPVMMVGVDIAREAQEGGLLANYEPSRLPSDREVLVGEQLAVGLAGELDIAWDREEGTASLDRELRGREIAMVGQAADGSLANDLFVIGGVLRSPVSLVNQMGLLAPIEAVQMTFALEDQAHELTIRGNDSDQAAALAETLGNLEVMQGLEVMNWQELAPQLVSALEISGYYSLIVLFITFLAAAGGVANTMMMAVYERRREFGMLLALGTTPRRLVSMIVVEGLMLGLIGVFIGSVLGGLVVYLQGLSGIDLVSSSSGEPTDVSFQGFSFNELFYPFLEVSDYVPGFVGVVVVAVLAVLIPAWRTARLEPVEAMRS